MDFNNKAIVVTGGGTGIGLSLAKLLGQQGAKVVITGRRQDRLEGAVAKLKELNIEAAYFQCDVADRAQVEALADFAWETYGSVDVIINNAGVGGQPTTVLDADLDQVRQVFDINLFGTWNGVSVFGKRFLEQGTPAAIYNVGSENCFFNAVPMNSQYSSTKHAMLSMTQALREEVPEFITVGLICPGLVLTEMTEGVPLGGMDSDEFAAAAIQQMKDEQFYSVSHSYNMVRIDNRYNELSESYAKYAPRKEGDDDLDVRSIVAKLMAAQAGQ